MSLKARMEALSLTAKVFLGVLAFFVGLGVLIKLAVAFDHRLAYKAPIAPTAIEEAASDHGEKHAEAAASVEQGHALDDLALPTPRERASQDEAAALETANREKVYEEAEYREFPVIGSRTAIWIVGQLHLLFAAFVLAVPIFAVLIEYIGYKTGDKRYDDLAYEFTKLLSVSFSLTATFGAGLTFMLIILYPKFTNYLMHVFSPTFLPYVGLFFFEAFFLYTYYYGWGKFSPRVHLALGVGLNVVGTGIMLIANAWLTFMTSPAGISETGALISTWEAVTNYTWMPINIHRIIANVAFGGSVAAAYAAFKFLSAKTDTERAHYDWMGYIGNFVAIVGLLPLPFAGYWLASEIYAFDQTMGLTMMGGAFSWLFIIQAFLIGNLFLAVNYYLWLGMGRNQQGASRWRPYIPYLLAIVTICFIVWATPRSPITTAAEAQAMGGSSHPILGYLGVMSAKNTAVNILILTTFVTFLLYRRGDKRPRVAWAKIGKALQVAILAAAAVYVVYLGIKGYYVEAKVRIGLSVPQVMSVLFAMLLVTTLDRFLLKDSEGGKITWGKMPARSQYVLIFLAVTFTWLMGLMGYVRSGLRQHWHVYGVIRDTSPGAFTPTLGYATQVVSVTVLLFLGLIGFVFWLAGLGDKGHGDDDPSSGGDTAPPPRELTSGEAT